MVRCLLIVTLGMMQICQSLDYVISNANTASKFPEAYIFGKAKKMDPSCLYSAYHPDVSIFIWVLAKTVLADSYMQRIQ